MAKRSRSNAGPSQRQLRVGEEVRHVLAEILARGDLYEPVLAGISITVSEVRMSPDLRHASAYVTPLGHMEDADAVLAALGRIAPRLQGELGRKVHLKFTPRLSFRLDTSFDYALKIETLLHPPLIDQDPAPDDGPADDGPADDTPADDGPANDTPADDGQASNAGRD